jgi:hypothetical protein
MPPRVQSPWREPTDRGLWDHSRRIFQCLCAHATHSVRQLAQQTGRSKRSGPRLPQARERRNGHPASWFWDTAAGRRWCRRLVVATRSPCGRKRGGGVETLRAFFARLGRATPRGCAPSAFRGVRQVVAAAVVETPQTWEPDGRAQGAGRESSGGVAETCWQRLRLVWQAVATGARRCAAGADERTDTPWQAAVDKRLRALGSAVWSVGRERASARIPLAAHGLACLRRPDGLPLMPDSVQSEALALAQQGRHAPKARKHAEAGQARRAGRPPPVPNGPEAAAQGAGRRAEGPRWEAAHRRDRQPLAPLSLPGPPCASATALPQPSAQVTRRFQAGVAALAAGAERQHLLVRPGLRQQVRPP